jgi:hypothetical protein
LRLAIAHFELQLWVGSASSWSSDAVVQPRACTGWSARPANDRYPLARISPPVLRTTVSWVDLPLDLKSANDGLGSNPV